MAVTIVLSDEQLTKLNKLSVIADHIQDISRKIAELVNDPLPVQMEQSIPGYSNIISLHSEMLKRRQWTFVIAGDSSHVKSAFVRALLRSATGEEQNLAEVLRVCRQCPMTVSFRAREGLNRFLVSVDGPGVCNPVALENWETLKEFIQQIQNGPSETSVAWITVQMESDILKEDLELLIYPEEITERNLEQLLDSLSNSDVLLYIADKDNLDSTEKFQTFTSEMRSLRILNQQLQPLVMMTCCLTVVVGCKKGSSNSDSGRCSEKDSITMSLLDDISGVNDEDSAGFSSENQPTQLSNGCKDSLTPIIKAMTKTLTSSIDSRILFHFGWLQMYVSRVLHHLRSFLSQAERSHEGRQETYKDILLRLTALTERSEAFLIALQMEIDSSQKEGVSLLRNHLMLEEVIERLSRWTDEESPDEELWVDVDSAIDQKIQYRLRHELQLWERGTKFFEVQRPRLIQLFEHRFRGIKTRLSSVETMISRHNSRIAISDEESPTHSSHSSATDDASLSLPLTLPFNVTLHWTQKLAIGLAAPLLIPLAFAAALLGLPIIGGLVAKDYVAEKRSEGKLREYRANKSAYLCRRTKEAIRAYVKSAALDEFVQSQLGAASRCIEQLRQEVPRQIEADRMQIVSLRDDDRETKDLERFYQPLFEVFEHCRLLLLVFRVLHIKRDKLEIDFGELRCPGDSVGCIICDGLSGRISAVQWTRSQDAEVNGAKVGHDAKDASLKYISWKLDAKTVEDYLLEEEAYRFQACPNIAKLLAVTKTNGQLYHVLEPIKASLRQHLATAAELMPPSSNRVKLAYLRRVLLQMLRGLDYLHDRGWVHFDLSLDSIGVGCDGVVKLTNISCRRMFFVPRDVNTSGLLRFTHLPPEVLANPPASYTSSAEMYSVGIAMYEMWTGEHAYWHDISCGLEDGADRNDSDGTSPSTIDSVDKFLVFVESNRPSLRRFRSRGADIDVNKSGDDEHEIWSDLMQRCWADGDRVTCKALLQLVEGFEGQSTISITEGYFDRG